MAGFYILMGGIGLSALLIMFLAVRADRKAHHTK